ncbi:MAG TPA: AtpZ/AtpI family protein [Bacteroidota bacterium]|nr:AtpZ/AtpI family protein [Bacteroidota bacterium]
MKPIPSIPKSWGVQYGPYLTLGLQLAMAVLVFFFLGKWLDQRLGTDPWLTLTGLAVGITGGLISFLRTVIALGKKSDEEMRQQQGSTKGEGPK